MTAPRNLPSFREYLAEDDSEDIVFGLRKLVSDIRSNWRTPYSAVKKEQERAWKKMTPAQQQALRAQLRQATLSLMGNIGTPVNTTVFKPTTKPEATAIPASFLRMSKDMQIIGERFLDEVSNGPSPILTTSEVALHKQQINENGIPLDRPLGTVTLKFVNDHQQLLTRLIVQEDDGAYGFEIYVVPQQLATALSKTPEAKRKESTIGVHYLILRLAHYFSLASRELGNKFAGNSLPDEPPKPGQPPGGKGPAPVTKP